MSTSETFTRARMPESESGSAASPELRTFLFADIRGYTRFTQERGDEAAVRLLGKFESITQDCVRRRGGEVIETRGDEILVVFASTRQALRAAAELQTLFLRETAANPSLPLHIGIGIEAGEAIPVEGGYRGEALNLAARLCNLAGPGEILTTEGVVYLGRQVRGLSYADRGEVPIKGFRDRIKVIRVLADSGQQMVTPPSNEGGTSSEDGEPSIPIGGFLGALPSRALVGRQPEWNRIMALMQDVMQGRGRFILLSGEPGVGKTRLAQEVTLKARHWGFLVVTGRCYEPEQNLPYYPFLEALTTLYDRADPSIRDQVPRRWPYLGRLLPEQVGFLPAPADGQEDQFLLFRAITGFVEAVAEAQPVALLLDDLHWADDASLALMQHLARYARTSRLLLFGTYRDVDVHRQHPLESMLLDLTREELVDEVKVRALDLSGTRELISEVMGDKDGLEEVAALVYQRSDGNALFVQEMLHDLIERGDIYRADGGWETRDVARMVVPKSIRSIIGQRLSRLDELSQEVLRTAAVLGQEFSFDDLAAVVSFVSPARGADGDADGRSRTPTEDDVEQALEQALFIGLVRQSHGDTYVFNHALTQQTLFAELSPLRRRRLHLAAGRALERLPDRERNRRAGELAWHFLEADDAPQALRFSMLAGQQAGRVFAHQEAERQYQTALDLARDLGDTLQEAQALERLATVLVVRARYDRALEMLEETARLYRRQGRREDEARSVAQMARVHVIQNTAREGIARLKSLIDEMEVADGASFGLASLWAALAELYSDIAEYENQLTAADRALQLVSPDDADAAHQQLRLAAEVTRYDALMRQGQTDVAMQVMEQLIPRAEAIGDLDTLARALGTAATYYARRGQFDKDRLYLERMLAVAERRDDRGQIILALMGLSTNAFELGDWSAAETYLRRADDIIRPLGDSRVAIWPLAACSWLSLRRGDLAAVSAQAQTVLDLLGGSGDAPWRRNILRILAESALLSGDPQQAARHLEQGQQEMGWERDPGFLHTLAWTRLALGQADEAQTLSERAVSQARLRDRQPDIISALTVHGAITGALGEVEQAESHLNEALEISRSVPLPFEEARAHYEAGMLDAAGGNRDLAQLHLEDALAIFERLGARADEDRVRAAIAGLKSM